MITSYQVVRKCIEGVVRDEYLQKKVVCTDAENNNTDMFLDPNMVMEHKRNPVTVTELTKEEKESVLRALGYYQIHLFDEKANNPKFDLSSESNNVTIAIKKIHQTIENAKESV